MLSLVGEHSVIMLKQIKSPSQTTRPLEHWIDGFVSDFKNRLVNLLGANFSHLPITLCLALLSPTNQNGSLGNNVDTARGGIDGDGDASSHQQYRNCASLPEISGTNVGCVRTSFYKFCPQERPTNDFDSFWMLILDFIRLTNFFLLMICSDLNGIRNN